MPHHLICTVGTSLLTNREDDRPWQGWNPRKPDPLPAEDLVLAWMSTAPPQAISAETNTLDQIGIDENDVLVFLHSDTAEGEFCARCLAAHYRPTSREARLARITALGYATQQFAKALKSLVDLALTEIRQARETERQPILCATGGFKAEIAFLNLLGALLQVEVVYIHERHRQLVRLPRLPLTWDAGFVADHRAFFQWIDEEPRPRAEVESRLKQAPDLRPLVEFDEDGTAYLNAAGDLLFKTAIEVLALGPRTQWPKSDPRPPDKKNKVSDEEHHRPKGWRRIVDDLCRMEYVTMVRYDEAAYGGPRVKTLDPATGVLGLRWERKGNTLPLRIETTARGSAQCDLVAEHLRGAFK